VGKKLEKIFYFLLITIGIASFFYWKTKTLFVQKRSLTFQAPFLLD
jgi:hypothetical protein